MVFLCIACIVLSSIALHGIALHRIAWHCMVLQRLHGVVQIIWRAGELPRSASSHFFIFRQRESAKSNKKLNRKCLFYLQTLTSDMKLLRVGVSILVVVTWKNVSRENLYLTKIYLVE